MVYEEDIPTLDDVLRLAKECEKRLDAIEKPPVDLDAEAKAIVLDAFLSEIVREQKELSLKVWDHPADEQDFKNAGIKAAQDLKRERIERHEHYYSDGGRGK